MRATVYKVKRNGVFVDLEDLDAVRDAEQQCHDPPPLEVEALPDLSDLDPEDPMEHLFHGYPEVKPYITATGKVRTGISAGMREIAEQILRKYGVTL